MSLLKKCISCNTSFWPYRGQKYCSESCRDKYRNLNRAESLKEYKSKWFKENKERIYAMRKEKRLLIPKMVKRSVRSEEEKKKMQKIRGMRAKDDNRFGGNRQKALERDNFTCKKCGTTDDLHVHHEDRSGSSDNPNNDLSNLITLCISCHGKEHKGDRLFLRGNNVSCSYCNKEFYRKQSDIGEFNYCSKECHSASMVGNYKTSELKPCKVCGKEFKAVAANVAIGKAKYCSKECSDIGQVKGVDCVCIYCNKTFKEIPSRIASGRGKYCSKPCSFADRKNKKMNTM